MKYNDLKEFVSTVTPVVEEMGGYISGFSTFHGVTVYVCVRYDETYETTQKVMETLQEAFDGEIHYSEYFECEGYVSHSQATLECINEDKALKLIKEGVIV